VTVIYSDSNLPGPNQYICYCLKLSTYKMGCSVLKNI
jgi:hypothetical protein